jgi:L-amino acid N-acyltransferase YncA
MNIRAATASDEEAIWEIFRAVIAPGDAFAFDPLTTREEMRAVWFHAGAQVYVAESEGRVVGSYFLKPNQPGLGAHVANGAYMVSPEARGLGVCRRMGEHSISEARRLGYRAMQFNLVVTTNKAAVNLWLSLGFEIIGTLPGVFHHATLGYVDAHVMFRSLLEQT